jgi:hypothetical protein
MATEKILVERKDYVLINNRQAGRRNRGRNNNGRPNGGGNRGGGDNGNRIDNRARGNATQLLEKYRNMARDAQLAGDRVNAEYYLQFADHYFRVLADNRARQEEQQGQGGQGQAQNRFRRNDESLDEFGDDFDGNEDSGDDFRFSQPERAVERAERPERQDRSERQPRQDRSERQDRGDRQPQYQQQPQFQQPQGEGQQERSQGQDGEGRGRRDRNRRDRGNEPREPRAAETVVEQAPQAAPVAPAFVAPVVEQAPVQEEAQAPRRRGRPRKSEVPVDDAAEPQGLDIAVLPPSIARADNDSEQAEDAPRKRTRRVRPATEAAE